MKKHLVTGLLALHALGWCGATIQGVLLQISPKGVSPDAFLFGAIFGCLTIAAAGVAWAFHKRRQFAYPIVVGGFGLLGAGGTLLGSFILVAGYGATDSYVMPLGAIAFVAGLVHLVAAWLAWSSARGRQLDSDLAA